MNSTLVCPKCGQFDKIEKVSSIVKSQTRTREVTEWRTETYKNEKGKEQSFSYPRSYDVVEITDLAKRLSPPEKPLEITRPGGCIPAIGIGCSSVFLLFCIITSLSVPPDFPGLISEPSIENIMKISIVPTRTGLTFALGGVLVLLLFFSLQRKASADARKYATVTLPRWRNVVFKWDQLYYCYRDDIVFMPEAKSAPASQMNIILYEDERAA